MKTNDLLPSGDDLHPEGLLSLSQAWKKLWSVWARGKTQETFETSPLEHAKGEDCSLAGLEDGNASTSGFKRCWVLEKGVTNLCEELLARELLLSRANKIDHL